MRLYEAAPTFSSKRWIRSIVTCSPQNLRLNFSFKVFMLFSHVAPCLLIHQSKLLFGIFLAPFSSAQLLSVIKAHFKFYQKAILGSVFLAFRGLLTNSLLKLPCKLIMVHLEVTWRAVIFQNFKTREVMLKCCDHCKYKQGNQLFIITSAAI